LSEIFLYLLIISHDHEVDHHIIVVIQNPNVRSSGDSVLDMEGCLYLLALFEIYLR
jgi:hypothetical protein